MANPAQLDQHIDRVDGEDPQTCRTDLRTYIRGERPDIHRPNGADQDGANRDRPHPFRLSLVRSCQYRAGADRPDPDRVKVGRYDTGRAYDTGLASGSAPRSVALAEAESSAATRDEAARSAPDGPRFQLRLLDGFVFERAGRVVPMPHSLCRVVAFLGVRGRCGRAEVAGTLWPEVTEARAQASLRTVLWRLNQLEATLVTGREMLSLSDAVEVDVREFVACARDALRDGAVPLPPSRLPALSLTGELLPGWYEDWVLFERERLRQLRMHALEAVAEQLTQAKRHSEAIEAAMVAVRLEPLRESATRALISAHLAENNVVEAVRKFESFRDELTHELGVEPTPELERLVQSSLDGQG